MPSEAKEGFRVFRYTVGVGKHAKEIMMNTRGEMLDFLLSDDALMVYSNSQQILAMANLFNININIFTYGGGEERWTEVCPDPDMVQTAEIQFGKWVPDMALYHSENSHFDLLVKDDSRLALLSLLAGTMGEKDDSNKLSPRKDVWEAVSNRKRKVNKAKVTEEEILAETETKQAETKCKDKEKEEELMAETESNDDDSKNLEEERVLFNAKHSGHKRTGPQEPAKSMSKSTNFIKCDQCDSELESEGLLNAHIESHHTACSSFKCEHFDAEFVVKSEFDKHLLDHSPPKHGGFGADQWNCNDCFFKQM